MIAIETRKAQLEARMRDLRHRLYRIGDELEQPVSERFAEQATEREDDEVLEDLGAAGAQEIRMIDAALKRIEDGSFGICESCEEPISIKRLEARPETTLCIRCKEDQERVERDFG